MWLRMRVVGRDTCVSFPLTKTRSRRGRPISIGVSRGRGHPISKKAYLWRKTAQPAFMRSPGGRHRRIPRCVVASCCVALRRIASRCVVLCLCCVLCCVVLRRVALRCVVLCCVVLCCVVLRCVVLCCVALRCVVLCCVVLCCVVLCCVVLCCVVSCRVVLCCVVLCCVALRRVAVLC